MKRHLLLIGAAAIFSALGTAAFAQVNFTVRAVSEPITAEQIRTGASAASTFVHDGIALGLTGEVFVIHRSATETTLLQMDLSTGNTLGSNTFSAMATALGGDYASAPGFPILQGELAFNSGAGDSGRLYVVDSAVSTIGDYALLQFDLATNSASEVFRGTAIGGWNSHDFLSDGTIVGALGEEREAGFGLGEPEIGIINPADMTPAWTTKAEMDDFVFVAGLDPGEELPTETVAVDRTSNTVYVFGHDNYRVFRVSNILDAGFDPATDIEELDIPEWNRADDTDPNFVDLHGMTVDEDGNLYGFDEGSERIVIWNGTDTFEYSLEDITIALGGDPMVSTVSPVLWRGIKARKINATQSELLILHVGPDYGVVRVVFGSSAMSVTNWSSYED